MDRTREREREREREEERERERGRDDDGAPITDQADTHSHTHTPAHTRTPIDAWLNFKAEFPSPPSPPPFTLLLLLSRLMYQNVPEDEDELEIEWPQKALSNRPINRSQDHHHRLHQTSLRWLLRHNMATNARRPISGCIPSWFISGHWDAGIHHRRPSSYSRFRFRLMIGRLSRNRIRSCAK